MPLITFFINRILEKEKIDKNIIFSYQCLNTMDNLDNDVKSYYYLHTNIECGVLDTSENLLNHYLSAKKVSNGFTRLVRLYKWKKARVYSWDSDLYMINKLDDLPKHHTVSLLSNNTIYRFKISDIINIWSEALMHREGLFSSPQHPKNPHTNQVFKIHDLYNLYFSICNTRYNMPLDIGAFFKVDFSLVKYRRVYFALLREKIINLYFKEAGHYELYEYIMTMLKKLKDQIGDVFVPHFPTATEQRDIVGRMKHFVLFYLRATLSCNPEIRNEYREKLIPQLKDFVEDDENSDIIYRIRTRSRTIITDTRRPYRYYNIPSNPPPPPPLTPSLPPITSRLPSPRRTRLPQIRAPPQMDMTRFLTETNTSLSHIRNRISLTNIPSNRITSRLNLNLSEATAFQPRNELPRTPTSESRSSNNIVNTYRSSLHSSGDLRNRMRFR